MRSDILNLRAQTGERSAEPSVEPPSGEVWAEELPPDSVAEEPAEPPTDEASEKS
jgi:hypothetical protein